MILTNDIMLLYVKGIKRMRVSLNLNSKSCQPLKFGRRNSDGGKCPKPPCDAVHCTPNIEQKYDLACRIIALQRQQIQALTAKKS